MGQKGLFYKMPEKAGKSILVILATLIAILVSEIFCRQFFVAQAVYITFKGDKIGNRLKLSEDPVLLYEWKTPPQEFSPIKEANVLRILSVGDSITYRPGYDIKGFFPFVLEQLLNRGARGGKRFEVINCGTPGYNLIQEARFLEKKAARFSPDLVIIGYCAPNDRTIRRKLIKYNDGLYCSDIKESYPYISLLPQRASFFLMRHSFLWRFINYQLVSLTQRKPGFPGGGKIGYFDLSSETEDAVKRIKSISSQEEFRLLFVIFPFLADGDQQECDWIIAQCNKYGIDYVDLRKNFEKFGYEKLRIETGDLVHPNSQGNQLAAEEISRFLGNSFGSTEGRAQE